MLKLFPCGAQSSIALSMIPSKNLKAKPRPIVRTCPAFLLIFTAAMMWGLPGTARANPLNSTNFTSLGALVLTTGNYLINTSGGNPALLDSASNVLYTGVIYNQGGTYDGNVAVFTFSSISIGAGVTITPSGDNPVALLSQGSIDLAGTIDASGTNGGNQGDGFGGASGPGGGVGGVGSGGSGQGPGGGGGGFDASAMVLGAMADLLAAKAQVGVIGIPIWRFNGIPPRGQRWWRFRLQSFWNGRGRRRRRWRR
jgi:hypothetical protein